ncbi:MULTISPECIES: peptidylprolyl isomerase [unclassified Acinetobacter]|uniref:peptidylprolyl isomerase n=1 Tax=unclassified Acinetobacter TaxID=196816 RepID=UPI0029342E11|nr:MULTISPECIES: peptidylprolyl isomerase [unclassified Acinetobacter]WOE30860.1 peptidylprolyl isomerase [Acinetobacter sp. SAAs470]WOE39055.1 peptidylprolyl isomerase [Acinetobacter sp. SAAs474]
MLKHIVLTSLIAGFTVNVFAAKSCATISTDMGMIEIELYPDKAPISVKNFTQYVNANFYPGTIFHRTIDGFVIQGGGLTQQLLTKPTYAAIKNEANNGLSNLRGSVAMARTLNPDSATSQFFINLADNSYLDYSTTNAGYAVFGRVIKGMSVVNKIAQQPLSQSQMFKDLPAQPVEILSVKMTCTK